MNERFLGNQSQDVVVDMAEILNKAQTTLSKIEKWIKENNRTGELVRDAEDCVLNILEETTDETLDYLAKLEKLCWNTQDWDAPIRSILEYITDMADEGENLYYEVTANSLSFFKNLYTKCKVLLKGLRAQAKIRSG